MSPLGHWDYRLLVPPSSRRRVLAFPTADGQNFGANLTTFCDNYLAPLSPTPARRTYDAGNGLHMSDLSVRFMGTSHDKLQRTIQLNRGLAPTTGRVPPLNFPQGSFVRARLRRSSRASSLIFIELLFVKSCSRTPSRRATPNSPMVKLSLIIGPDGVTSFHSAHGHKLVGLLGNSFAVIFPPLSLYAIKSLRIKAVP